MGPVRSSAVPSRPAGTSLVRRSQNLVRGLQHRAPVVDADRVHEHVKPAERLGGVADGPPGCRGGGEVRRHGRELYAGVPGQRAEPLLVHVRDGNPGAGPRQGERDRRADPARTGDESRAAPQSKPVRHSEQ